ncbi:MAG: DUF1211 domain-containing protein [Thermoplasmata archaeon]|nr:DUF1211 domain-containing protein [Thermoplasmata archaeon]
MEDDERSISPDLPAPPWIFRGRDLSRILSLSDGVFAFAMTLLVLGLVLPIGAKGGAVAAYLQTQTFASAMYAYILTFFVIGLWWQSHHLIFGYIQQYDRVLVRVNSVFLVTIAILPFATIVLNAAGNAPVGVGFFAVNQIAAGLSLALLWRYASGSGHLVHEKIPESWRSYLSRITMVTPVVFALSIPAAFWSFQGVNAGEIVWLGAFVFPMAIRHQARSGGPPTAVSPAALP